MIKDFRGIFFFGGGRGGGGGGGGGGGVSGHVLPRSSPCTFQIKVLN